MSDAAVTREARLRARGEVYHWLSAAFAQPEAEILDPEFFRLGREAFAKAYPAMDLAGFDVLAETWAVPDPARLLVLQREYTRLFIGPAQASVRPYESCYFGEDKIMTARTQAVHALYAQSGVVFDGQRGTELPDHVAVELLFLAFVYSGDTGHTPDESLAIAQAFLQEHAGQWMPAFAAQVIAATKQPFYRVAAELLKTVVSA